MSQSSELKPKQKLVCPGCGHVLANGFDSSLDTIAALTITALILIVLSVSFPFMSFDANGQSNSIDLLAPITELYSYDFSFLSLLVLGFIVVLPAIYLAALLCLSISVKFGLTQRSKILLARIVTRTLPWAMADVFIFGVLVAIVKIISIAPVELGFSFWAYIVFTLLFLRITIIVDTHRVWSWVVDE